MDGGGWMQIWELAFLSEKFIRFISETLPALSSGNLFLLDMGRARPRATQTNVTFSCPPERDSVQQSRTSAVLKRQTLADVCDRGENLQEEEEEEEVQV